MSKALSITALLVLSVLSVATATAVAQPAPSPVERLKLQEQATGNAERGFTGSGSSTSRLETAPAISPIVAQERGRATDPRLLGPQLPAPVVVIERRGGFHWVDAGAGAGAALALASLVAAAAGLRRRSERVQPGEGRA